MNSGLYKSGISNGSYGYEHYITCFQTFIPITTATRSQLLRCGSDSNLAKEFEQAALIHRGEADPISDKPSDVKDFQRQGLEIYTEVGLLTENELMKFTDVKPTALKLESSLLQNQLGDPSNLFVISLAGLSCGDIHSLRRTKVFCEVGTSQDEILVAAANMLAPDQGSRTYKHHLKTQTSNNPLHLRDASGFNNIHTIQDLMVKAEGFKEAKTAKEQKKQDLAEAMKEDDSSEDQEEDGDVSRAKAVVTQSSSRLLKLQEDKQAKAKAKGGKGLGKKRRKTDEDVSDMGSVLVDVTSLPKELQLAAEALKAVPKCFAGLDVNRIFAGEKLMRSVNHVT